MPQRTPFDKPRTGEEREGLAVVDAEAWVLGSGCRVGYTRKGPSIRLALRRARASAKLALRGLLRHWDVVAGQGAGGFQTRPYGGEWRREGAGVTY